MSPPGTPEAEPLLGHLLAVAARTVGSSVVELCCVDWRGWRLRRPDGAAVFSVCGCQAIDTAVTLQLAELGSMA